MIEGVSLAIEKFKKEKGIKGYVEAICLFVKENELDFYDLVDQLDPILKKKVKSEYIKGNFLPDLKVDHSIDDFLNG